MSFSLLKTKNQTEFELNPDLVDQLTVSADGDADAIATAVFSTVLGASAGGLVVLVINKVSPSGGKWSFLLTLNGMLGGMVAQVYACRIYTHSSPRKDLGSTKFYKHLSIMALFTTILPKILVGN